MLDPFFVGLLKAPLDRAGQALAARNLDANTLTLAGFAAGLVGAGCIALGWYGLAILVLAVNRLADGLDGAVARATTPTDFGAYLDIVLDFVVYTAVAGGFALADPANTAPAVVLMISFMGTASAFLAFAIFAAKNGVEAEERGKSFFYVGGLMEGSETIIFFLVALLWPGTFPVLAWIFAVLCWVTVAQRIFQARAAFGED
jgi:phosphatidylglycerophosphate synthase